MISDNRPPHYHSFLVTVWEERDRNADVPIVLRFGLEKVHRTSKRRVFATFEQMMLFLREAIENLSDE